MSNEQINQLVESTLNPYLVFKVENLHNEEEYNKLLDEVPNKISEQELTDLGLNSVTIELEDFNYMFIKSKFYPKYIEMVKRCGFEFKLTQCIDEIWEMNNLNIFDEGDPAPEATKLAFPDDLTNFEIIKQMFETKYSMDDLLDKITRTGIESLNEIQKRMLNESK